MHANSGAFWGRRCSTPLNNLADFLHENQNFVQLLVAFGISNISYWGYLGPGITYMETHSKVCVIVC